ncbi:MAG: succinylglutamate desuccinylase/aspartoacylase family protein [Actinobacteria bacterium]|nr:succinylglutamate desuccinylase/aspartoacylase family protein [Actinomycetota bacterium]
MSDSPISCTVDLDAQGRQLGRLRVPRSTNTAGWASVYVPIVTVASGSGPTVLVLGGSHGDEYEGQVAALNLARELAPEQVSGRVTIIPCLSMEASAAGTRLWPSGANFNRSFPGSTDGPANEQLADFLTRELFPRADVVIDMHSGGRSTLFLPCSHMHVVENAGQRRQMLEGMLAWNTDWHYLYIDVAGTGLLPVEAERQGKVVVTTELGGGGHVTAATHRISQDGLANVLRWAGALEGEVETRDDAVILDGRDPANYLFAQESGVFEALVDPGEPVTAGQPLGRLHFLERPDREPETIEAPLAGVVAGIRAISTTAQGDSVIVLAQPIEADAIV